jgi:hypothetical protein
MNLASGSCLNFILYFSIELAIQKSSKKCNFVHNNIFFMSELIIKVCFESKSDID